MYIYIYIYIYFFFLRNKDRSILIYRKQEKNKQKGSERLFKVKTLTGYHKISYKIVKKKKKKKKKEEKPTFLRTLQIAINAACHLKKNTWK